MPAPIPSGLIYHLRMDEQGSQWNQRSRGNQSLVILTAADQSNIHRISSGFPLGQHAVHGIGGTSRRHLGFDPEFFLESVYDRSILARRRDDGSNRYGDLLICRDVSIGQLLFVVGKRKRLW